MDQKFWLRVATRNDSAATQADRQRYALHVAGHQIECSKSTLIFAANDCRLQELANTAMRMVDAIVKKSDSQLTDSGRVLQKILAAAADERGEWQVPLPEQKLDAMRKVQLHPRSVSSTHRCMSCTLDTLRFEATDACFTRVFGWQELEANASALDESLLANAFAWMRKASNDKLDGEPLSSDHSCHDSTHSFCISALQDKQRLAAAGMVALLQQVLQLYAARALVSRQPGLPPDDAFLEEVLAAHESTWEDCIRQELAAGGVGQAALLAAVRRKMESVVLTLPNGSYAQRVQVVLLHQRLAFLTWCHRDFRSGCCL